MTCCQEPGNLVSPPDPSGVSTTWPRSMPTVLVCQVCGRKHYGLQAEPARFGATMQPLGKKAG
jgi:hypothetical protein